MKNYDYGKLSLFISIIAWGMFAVFTLLSWGTFDVNSDDFLTRLYPYAAFSGFPLSVIAGFIGVVALVKRKNRVFGVFGIVTSVPLSLFLSLIYWIAINGGV